MKWLAKNWHIVLGTGAFILAVLVAVKYKIPELFRRVTVLEGVAHEQEVTEVNMADVVKKSELYDKDGRPHYQHREACDEVQKTICSKIDGVKADVTEIKGTLKEMDKARDKAKEDLVKTMTRVEDMINLDRTQEMQTLADMIVKKINGN